jgi:DHA2 family multidrug resistance protein-like MFS transporter
MGLVVLLLATTVLTMDLGVLWLAAPHLAADLRPSGSELLWVTDVYGFMMAGLLVTAGALGDRVGRRRLLLVGAVTFAVASLLCAWSASPAMLIGARALLGVSGALILPSTLSLIAAVFPDPGQRARAIAMWVTAMSLGVAIGPVVGGVLLQWFWWGSVFLIGVPVMVLLLALGPVVLPEYRSPDAARLDPLSVALFMMSVLPVVYAVKKYAEHGFGPHVWLPAPVGLAFGVLFVRRQNRLEQPLLDLRLFRERSFSAALALLVLVMAAMSGVEYLLPQFFQMVVGLPPLTAGLWLLPGAAGLLIGSQLTPVLGRSLRPASIVALGTAVATAGFVLVAAAGPDDGPLAVSAGLGILLLGLSPTMVLGTDLMVGSAPSEKAGSASAVAMTATDFGSAAGIALIGSVTTSVYRGEVAAAIPAGSPAADTIGGAVAHLPAGSAALDVARTAFTHGVNAAAWVGAALCVVLTVVVPLTLKHLRTGGPAEAEQSERVDA